MKKRRVYGEVRKPVPEKKYFTPRKVGLWENLYPRENETTYLAQGMGKGSNEVAVSRYQSPQSLESADGLTYDILVEVSDKKRGLITLYLMDGRFVGGEENIGHGRVEIPNITKARMQLNSSLVGKYPIQKLFTDEGLPKSLQKNLRILWNY